MTDVRVMGTRV